jgi:hypothetical protein
VSGETLIRIVEDVLLEDGCSNNWHFIDEAATLDATPFYFCAKHQRRVPLQGPCPSSEFWARVGETVTVPSKVARRLVQSELAEYPTHAPEPDQAVQESVSRVNALMDAQGLPHMDAESLGVWKVEGRQNPYQRPAKPRDKRLANDLGLDAADIAAMRDAAQH